VYTGAGFDPNPDDDEDVRAEGQTYNVVVGLMRECDLLGKGHTVYTDNYYTSPRLFDFLTSQNTNGVGTVRTKRKEMPKALQGAKLTVGQVVFRHRQNLLAIKWKDKKDVALLSTKHGATMSLTTSCRPTPTQKLKPTVIMDYNSHMGGVDLNDQLLQYYAMSRKTMKWWKKLFFHLFNMCTANAYIIWKMYSPKKMTHHDFLVQLCKDYK
jgi:hypothetical protein